MKKLIFNKRGIATGILFAIVATCGYAADGNNEKSSQHHHFQKIPMMAMANKVVSPTEIFKIENVLTLPFPNKKEIEDDDTDVHPADDLYQIWMNEKVNPYKVAINELTDSVSINCAGYIHPLKGARYITSYFGRRSGRFHAGIDLRVNVGEEVLSAFDGKVRITGFDEGGYGNFVVVRHANGFETLYGHLSKIEATENQMIKAGDVVGLAGNTGRSTGPHLHFEFRYLGNPINPKQIVNFDNNCVYNEHYLLCKNSSFKELRDFYSAEKRYHVVKEGDTLYNISKRYGTTVARLCELNRINEDKPLIRLEQRIRYF